MAIISINTVGYQVESKNFNEPLSSLIERAKEQSPYKGTDISGWDVVAGMNPNKELMMNERYQFSMGVIHVSPPAGTNA